MTTTKARVFTALMRHRHLLKGKLKKETFTFDTSIAGFRDTCEKGAERYAKVPTGVSLSPEVLAGIPAEWIIPAGTDREKLIFYVHGGGYVSGSCHDHRAFVAKLARDTNVTTLHYEYRLAPEHPFPAALDDSVAVYKTVLEKGYAPENIVMAGESAGGGLTLAILLALKEQKLPLPKAAVAISPWTDLTCSGDSYRTKNKVSVAPLNSWNVFRHYYAGSNDLRNPKISPLYGDLKGLPPLFINSGEDDELFDDGRQFYEKAKAAGVEVTFKAGKDMVHCYPLLSPMFREAEEAMQEILAFIGRQLNREQPKK